MNNDSDAGGFNRAVLVNPRRGLQVLLAVVLLSVTSAAPLMAQTTRPTVHVLATGGTIGSAEAGGTVSAEGLLEALPGLEEMASVTAEQFAEVGSSRLTTDQWLALARRIDELFTQRPDLDGLVITHGTDTMEETAYFLHLTVQPRHATPIVLTGAMRPTGALSADGPANLFNAIRLAGAPHARGRGTLVLMNDEIHGARSVTKRNTSRPDAFESPQAGALGFTASDTLVFARSAERRPAPGEGFSLQGVTTLPRVDIAYAYLDADGAALQAFGEAGARGVVLAGFGSGRVTPAQEQAVRDLMREDVQVVMSSRTGSGWVAERYQDPEASQAGRLPLIPASDLLPEKARILLMLALTETTNRQALREVFLRY